MYSKELSSSFYNYSKTVNESPLTLKKHFLAVFLRTFILRIGFITMETSLCNAEKNLFTIDNNENNDEGT